MRRPRSKAKAKVCKAWAEHGERGRAAEEDRRKRNYGPKGTESTKTGK